MFSFLFNIIQYMCIYLIFFLSVDLFIFFFFFFLFLFVFLCTEYILIVLFMFFYLLVFCFCFLSDDLFSFPCLELVFIRFSLYTVYINCPLNVSLPFSYWYSTATSVCLEENKMYQTFFISGKLPDIYSNSVFFIRYPAYHQIFVYSRNNMDT